MVSRIMVPMITRSQPALLRREIGAVKSVSWGPVAASAATSSFEALACSRTASRISWPKSVSWYSEHTLLLPCRSTKCLMLARTWS